MMRETNAPSRMTLAVALVLGSLGCGRSMERRTESLAVKLTTSSSSVTVGDETVTIRIVPAIKDAQVWLSYFPFVHRVKDSLASPDEAVRVVDATPASEDYRAALKLDRPGPWKVAVRVRQRDKPDTIVYFTLHVRKGA